jgi:phosphoribosylglycinamide formyltransferase-1
MRLGFLASNNGTSMRAIVTAIGAGQLKAAAALVVSNRKDATALTFAREHGVPTRYIPTLKDPEAADAALTGAMKAANVSLIVLSGYLRKLGPITLAAYRYRILNVHPALLPDYGGEGMYGRRVHEAVMAAGERFSGATVHVVDEQYDHGLVVAQRQVLILERDDVEALERRVMAAETALFIETLQRLASGDMELPRA